MFVIVADASAQPTSDPVQAQTYAMPTVEPTEYNGDVRDLPQVTYKVPRYYHLWNEFKEPVRIKPVVAGSSQPEESAQVIPFAAMPAPSKNFAGIGFGDSVTGGQGGAGWPPDTNGDVGPTVYIQAVNDTFGIFDKSSGTRLAAFTEDSLWSTAGTGTPCHGNNEGDPVVLHDGSQDRWILTNFAFAFNGSGDPIAPFYQCFAISKTSDPVAGGWWFYAVQMDTGGTGKPPANTLNDYPKFGLWTDCLYMGANGFNNASGLYAGAIFAAFNRTTLFAGQALSSTNSSLGFISTSPPFSLFPANLLGTTAGSAPPAGTPEYFVDESSSASNWEVRKFVQGATTCGAGSSLSMATQVAQTSYPFSQSDYIPQKNTTNKLDPLEDRVMQKVQYRKIGSAESLWVVHTTGDGTTTSARPQWAQINITNKTIATAPVQQQIYAPDTTLHRWMGSLAVDGQGNMALGYSTSSATAFPSIAYSGRLVSDTLNQLPQGETQLIAGAGSQTNKDSNNVFISRWGDYSAMSIDPSDDCTFWYTNEYYDTQAQGTAGNWQTRIGAFKFPGCVSSGLATKLAFTLEPSASYASGATITVKVSIEDAGGSVVTTDTSAVTLALSGGTVGAVLSGTKTANAVAGVATFSTLAVDKVGTSYALNATDGSLTGIASTPFNITVGVAKTVTFTTQPALNANIAAGATIPLVAHVVDAGGNPLIGQNIALSILNNPGTSTLSVTTNPVGTNASGDATFSAASLNKVGTGYTLKATDNTTPAATAATSNAFNITVGAAKTVTFTTQPAANANIIAGATIPLVAHVADVNGNGVPNQNIALSIGNNVGGSTLTVTTNPVATNTSGDATFASVSLNKVGNGDTLVAMDNTTATATPATSNAFNIVASAPTQLAFLQQPTNGTAGVALSPPVTVRVLDSKGNVVTADTHSVTLTVASGPGAFDPGATRTMAFSNGVATFNNLVFDVAGTGYTLTAADAGDSLNSAASSPFNIVPGVPRLIFTTEPADVTRGNALGTVAVTEDDGSGNMIPDNVSSADFTITTTCGTFDLGSVTMSNGVATLVSSQIFYTLGSGLKINATTGPLSGTSASFSVVSSDLVFADGFDGCRL